MREIIKAAVNGYVSTIKAKLNAKQNVIVTIIFSLCDKFYIFLTFLVRKVDFFTEL